MTEFFALALSSPFAFAGTFILLFLIGLILESVVDSIGRVILEVWRK